MDKSTPTSSTPKASPESRKTFKRFDIVQRIEHSVLLISFSLLGITGLPQKFPYSPTSQWIVQAFGGIEMTRQIHHINAVILMAVSIFHILSVMYRIVVLRSPLTMVPLVEDFKHLFHDIAYYLGLRKHKAYYGRYNYAEKVEYLAVVWGTIVMAITGFMMWNPIATTNILPGGAIPAAKAAHGGEAVLAVLAIILWHFYHVHLRHFNKSMLTGKISYEEMEHEHPAELAEIEAGTAWQRPSDQSIRMRQRFYFPAALIFAVFMGYGLVWFVTLENTYSVTTVSSGETVQVFVPLTPTPRPTPVPTTTLELPGDVSPNSWKGAYEALFRNRCGTCHGVTAVGGLSLGSYQSALEGGDSGPAIVPGDPDASTLVQLQAEGGHPGQLTDQELQTVIEWIESGAPEQ